MSPLVRWHNSSCLVCWAKGLSNWLSLSGDIISSSSWSCIRCGIRWKPVQACVCLPLSVSTSYTAPGKSTGKHSHTRRLLLEGTAMTPQLAWWLLSGKCHFSKQAAATQSHGSLYLPSTMSSPQSHGCFASPAGRMDRISSSCGPDKPSSSVYSGQVNLVPAAVKVTMHLIFLNNYSKTTCHISAYVFTDLNIAQPWCIMKVLVLQLNWKQMPWCLLIKNCLLLYEWQWTLVAICFLIETWCLF